MSIIKDRSAVGSVVSGTTTTNVTLNSVAAGSFIPILLPYYLSTAASLTLTDSLGDTIHAALAASGSSGDNISIYYIEGASAGNHQITATMSAGSDTLALIVGPSYTGVKTSGSIDTTSAILTGTSASPASHSITTANSGELIIGGIAMAGTATYSGFNSPFGAEFTGSSGGFTGCMFDGILGSAGSISMGCTSSANRYWMTAIAAFQPALAQAPCGYMQTYAMR